MNMPIVDLKNDQLVPAVFDILSDFSQIEYFVLSVIPYKHKIKNWSVTEIMALELMVAYDELIEPTFSLVEVLCDECMITADYARTLYEVYTDTLQEPIFLRCRGSVVPITVTDTFICLGYEP